MKDLEQKLSKMIGEKQLKITIQSMKNPAQTAANACSANSAIQNNHSLNQIYLNALRKQEDKQKLRKKQIADNLDHVLSKISRIAQNDGEDPNSEENELSPSIFKYYKPTKQEMEAMDNEEEVNYHDDDPHANTVVLKRQFKATQQQK